MKQKARVSSASLIVLGASLLLVMSVWPMRYLASPKWNVQVVADDGHSISGVQVRLVYENYSVESQSHEITLASDENGRALFEPQYERASFLQRVFYSFMSALGGVHASFGRHAYVFAFGNGFEGDAVSGKYVTDWTGSPRMMESKIVVKKQTD